MDRRTFLKSASMKGTAIVTASAVGTEMLHAAESIGASDVASGKRNAPKAKRLPEDLQELVKDSSLLRKPDNLTVACYTFPNYHASALHDKIYGPGWTEYNLVRSARPWFQGHAQPRGPLLGEMDESKPGTWEKYNELCKQSGIDVLIWDWYWYNNEPCLHEALENGFLRASNRNDVKFACMWTNHPWYVLYPTLLPNGYKAYPPSFAPADGSLKECWQSLSYIISRYCHLENYWRIDDKPVVCIWDPRGPLLGEMDESKPGTWEKYNELCKQSGIDVLIWDWYWYNNEPCLHEALENGFLRASNRNDVKFACMWTNHPWYVLYPTLLPNGYKAYPPSFAPADGSLKECWQSLSYIISRYCHLENYWRIDDKPVVCIWDPNRLEKNIGVDGVKQLFAELTEFARKLGHKGLHFHSSGFYSPNSKEVGYNTAGSYNPFTWVADNYQPKNIELPDYGVAAADVAFKLWPKHHDDFAIPYLPSLSPGWDSTPRYIPPVSRPDQPNRDAWPNCVILDNENPASFKALVQSAFAYLNKHKDVPPILTIACFNEWTEGHYLLPDNRFGYGMLDALAEAVGKSDNHQIHGFF